ncbi:NAD(P)H-binding protein [Lentilactobacillus raoultii]|uniref:NAD(P)H-binding protein n=1 Tax=Lentilactobacillus raoultii TaxID=1987503 RepID=A0ABW3PQB5_9LACO|nr:NAD(P)H-binding protein [Lentilactobacillus raoultii]
METIVVTGGSGFAASWIIRELLTHDYQVRAFLQNMADAHSISQAITLLQPLTLSENLTFYQFKPNSMTLADWQKSMEGADAVICLPLSESIDVDQSRPLKDDPLTILKAGKNCHIKRVIVTNPAFASLPLSSTGKRRISDEFWPDATAKLNGVESHLVEAEKSAWQYAKENQLELTSILPGTTLGPILSPTHLGDNQLLLSLFNDKKMAPKIEFNVSDVRDLAILYRLALEKQSAIGHRFPAADQKITLAEIAKIYQRKYSRLNLNFTYTPNWLIRLAAIFSSSSKATAAKLKIAGYDTQSTRQILAWKQRPVKETIVNAADLFTLNELVKNVPERAYR